MALTFDERGLLVPGIYEATLDEVEEHFGRFQRTDVRMRLMGRLRDYVAEVGRAIPGSAIIVDGSFVMKCIDEPDGIDVILLLPHDWDQSADLKPRQYNLVSRRRTKKEFRIEVFAYPEGSSKAREATEFFMRVNVKWCELFGWPEESPKGVVRVQP